MDRLKRIILNYLYEFYIQYLGWEIRLWTHNLFMLYFQPLDLFQKYYKIFVIFYYFRSVRATRKKKFLSQKLFCNLLYNTRFVCGNFLVLIWILWIWFFMVVFSLLYQSFELFRVNFGYRVKFSLIDLSYERGLNLSKISRETVKVKQIRNLYSSYILHMNDWKLLST